MTIDIDNYTYADLNKISIHKCATPNYSTSIINSELSYSITLENISDINFQSVNLIEDIIEGLIYKPNSLKINGLTPINGDINLNEDAVIPIGFLPCNDPINSKVVITFDVFIKNLPSQLPVTNFTRVFYKYILDDNLVCEVSNSNKVSTNFNIVSLEKNYITISDNYNISHKSLGDLIEFKFSFNPNKHIKNVVLYDFINNNTNLLSIEIIKNGESIDHHSSNLFKVDLGDFEANDIITIIIYYKIKSNFSDLNSSIIKLQPSIEYIDSNNSNYALNYSPNPVYIFVYDCYLDSYQMFSSDSIEIGNELDYSIYLKNIGTVPIEELILNNILDSGLEYVENSATIQYDQLPICKTIYNLNDNKINIGILDIGESVLIKLKVKVIHAINNIIEVKPHVSYSYLKYPYREKNQYEFIADLPINIKSHTRIAYDKDILIPSIEIDGNIPNNSPKWSISKFNNNRTFTPFNSISSFNNK